MSTICFIILCISAFSLTFFLTWYVKLITTKKAILDIPNERSSHSVPTPRGGGLAIAFVWIVALFCFYILNAIDKKLFYALLPGILLIIIGLIDDIVSLRPLTRFFVQFIVALSGLLILKGLKTFDLGFYSVNSTYLLSFFALIAIIWSINLFNFLDGIDGYLSTEIIFIFFSIFILFNDQIVLLSAIIVFGFLLWNWQPAKIFMGDVGSAFLGYTVAIFAIYYQNESKCSIIIWLLLSSLFWFDATVTLFRRIKNKEKLSQAHRKHAFQRIVQAGWSHQKTVLWSLILNLIGIGFVLLALRLPKLALIFLMVDVFMLFFVLRYIDKKKPFEYEKS